MTAFALLLTCQEYSYQVLNGNLEMVNVWKDCFCGVCILKATMVIAQWRCKSKIDKRRFTCKWKSYLNDESVLLHKWTLQEYYFQYKYDIFRHYSFTHFDLKPLNLNVPMSINIRKEYNRLNTAKWKLDGGDLGLFVTHATQNNFITLLIYKELYRIKPYNIHKHTNCTIA